MAKLDRTVLVYSSSVKELEALRTALEPVISKYREATSFSEACAKSKNEKVDVVVLGSETEALREFADFFPFARKESILKTTPIYVWAPVQPAEKEMDANVKFFQRGQYRQLLESFDDLGAEQVPLEELAKKTKAALPIFLQHLIALTPEKLSPPLGLKLSCQTWSTGLPDAKNVRTAVTSKMRLIEGLWVFTSPTNFTASEVLDAAIRDALRSSAAKIQAAFPILKTKYFETQTTSENIEIKPLIGEDPWNCLPLLNSSQEQVAQIFVKFRPRTKNA